jgi:adenylate kinase family enzyme
VVPGMPPTMSRHSKIRGSIGLIRGKPSDRSVASMHTAAVSEASCDHSKVLPLRAVDPLPHRPRRVLVAGCSGAGKSTVAAALADRLGIPHHELDALRHGPGWVPRAEFAADVAAFAATECWITEWQGAAVRPLLLARADLVVWLDLPRRRVFGQLLRRTVRRRVRRIELWNGNVEPPLWTVVTDSEHVLRWAWSSYRRDQSRMRELSADRTAPPVVRLRSRNEVRRWLAAV